MKRFSTVTCFAVCLLSCQKEGIKNGTEPVRWLEKIKGVLKDSVAPDLYATLNFNRTVLIKEDSSEHWYGRIPFKGKNSAGDFIVLQAAANGTAIQGRIVHLSKDAVPTNTYDPEYTFNGTITIRSLKGELLLYSAVVKGYVQAFETKNTYRVSILPGGVTLPVVVVVCHRKADEDGRGGDRYSVFNDRSMFSYESTGTSAYYSRLEPEYTYGGGNSYEASGETESTVSEPVLQRPLRIDFENGVYEPAIDIEKYLKCFATIPDDGATCSMEILVDIPVDKDPGQLFDWQNGSPGHTFLQLKKSGSGQLVMQNIGFYPQQGWKVTLTPAPVDGKLVDNGGHEYNASLKMDLTPAQLEKVINEIRYLSRFIKYDIDEYNCTDFALDVFNKARTIPLEIPLYDIPGTLTAAGTRTPQGLYARLKSMQQSGDAEAPNITIPGVKGWVANSTGPCN